MATRRILPLYNAAELIWVKEEIKGLSGSAHFENFPGAGVTTLGRKRGRAEVLLGGCLRHGYRRGTCSADFEARTRVVGLMLCSFCSVKVTLPSRVSRARRVWA